MERSAMLVHCPGCKTAFDVARELTGATIRCRQCEMIFKVKAANGPPTVPVVSGADDAPRERRLRTEPAPAVPAAPRRPVREPQRPAAPPQPRSSSGVFIVAGVLLFGLLLVG